MKTNCFFSQQHKVKTNCRLSFPKRSRLSRAAMGLFGFNPCCLRNVTLAFLQIPLENHSLLVKSGRTLRRFQDAILYQSQQSIPQTMNGYNLQFISPPHPIRHPFMQFRKKQSQICKRVARKPNGAGLRGTGGAGAYAAIECVGGRTLRDVVRATRPSGMPFLPVLLLGSLRPSCTARSHVSPSYCFWKPGSRLSY